MADRVLATNAARDAVQKMKQIITGPLIDTINDLNAQGKVLSQRDQWDGKLAEEFRANWPETDKSLRTAQETLEELRTKIDKITENIMVAGGNL